ncbi:helicase-exonuclease AddAB subunit AddA [Lentilactobacillus sunkii]|uniref:ATP-dependent helicase/nuclease subunit A n=1 Tax=Lentilactobacillus sunkii DSM 19904 TaxID=1423808 RepID=A0A0R1L1N5_9LACO|nr:helicase-exonuclease AddAB subunit AddA [Lentilactobacillus sunkii]KRK87603.1 ATP-dependent helicase nuclease subunit A [Lentilactobacillus sunkii DSM 19904]
MAFNYTPDQQKAIKDRPEGNVLVSASAGSGKTRVLVDRIIDMVKNQHIDVDQLLVVTFTNAAAKEMRQRLQVALREEFNNAPEGEKSRLLTQIQKVAVSDITTMDAYCQKLVGRYYYLLGIDPNFRILADDTEKQLLKDQVWDTVREDLYGNDEDGSFARLTENFSSDRSDDGLADLIYRLDEFANVTDDPEGWLDDATAFYDLGGKSLFESDFYRTNIAPKIDEVFARIELNHEYMIKLAQSGLLDKDEKAFGDQLKAITSLQETIAKLSSFDAIREALLGFEFIKLPSLSKPQGDQKFYHEQIKEINNQNKDDWKAFYAQYFSLDEQANVDLMAASKKRVAKLISAVRDFRSAYAATKHQRHLMEFIDIEQAAYQILNSDSEQARQVQAKLRDQYYEIMTDEYQDNNRLQDAILNKLAKDGGGNRFMVGDAKQSIYRFRLADPQMFINKQNTYALADNHNELITLADNFRSAENVDNFINLIFEQIMDRQVGEIDYSEAKLQFGAKYYPDDLKADVEVMLYSAKKPLTEGPELPDEQQMDADQGQVEMIAQKIRQIMDNHEQVADGDSYRPVDYGDFAVISPTRNSQLTMSQVFKEYGIPAEITGAKSYLKTTEIQVMLSLLSIIDNPYQDIPLVAVLRSPIVGLDENQLAYLRINQKTGNYYESVLKFYREYPNSEPNEYAQAIYPLIDTFFKQLDHFKNVAQQDGLVALIWEIYQQTGFLDYVGGMPGGYQRQTNLHALYERAADYEKNGFKGLFRFVLFIERMQARDDDLATAVPNTSDNMVHVMTIHGSKGLQFPIVFLNDIGKQFNPQDTRGRAVLNDHLGVGISYLDTETREIQEPLQRQAVVDVTKNAGLSEEMRKLYVALTRAEQRLFLVGKVNPAKGDKGDTLDVQSVVSAWQSKTDESDLLIPMAERNSANKYLDWIGPAISRHPDVIKTYGDSQIVNQLQDDQSHFTLTFYDNAKVIQGKMQTGNVAVEPNEWVERQDQTESGSEPDRQRIADIMNFDYPHQAATQTTAYQSVSEIKRLFDDPDNVQLGNNARIDSSQMIKPGRYTQPSLATPKFISENGTKKPAPTEIGTATHLVLQQVDLHQQPTEKNVSELIANLVKAGILQENVAQSINVDGILRFYASDVGQDVLANPDTTYREVPFSLLMKANQAFKDFDEDDDQRILIHGIIDGYVETSDGVVLFDYKTDRLTPKTTIDTIRERYEGQLRLYGRALEKILGKPVSKKYLYLLSSDQLVPVQ